MKLSVDRWWLLRVAVVGGVLVPLVYYHSVQEKLDWSVNMLYFAVEMLIAVCLTFTMFVIELYYKTVRRDSNTEAAKDV